MLPTSFKDISKQSQTSKHKKEASNNISNNNAFVTSIRNRIEKLRRYRKFSLLECANKSRDVSLSEDVEEYLIVMETLYDLLTIGDTEEDETALSSPATLIRVDSFDSLKFYQRRRRRTTSCPER
jgi:hypothetical protein